MCNVNVNVNVKLLSSNRSWNSCCCCSRKTHTNGQTKGVSHIYVNAVVDDFAAKNMCACTCMRTHVFFCSKNQQSNKYALKSNM